MCRTALEWDEVVMGTTKEATLFLVMHSIVLPVRLPDSTEWTNANHFLNHSFTAPANYVVVLYEDKLWVVNEFDLELV